MIAGATLPINRPSGTALLLSLLFLTAMTLFGLVNAQSGFLHRQVLLNYRQQQTLLDDAQAALHWAEQALLKRSGPPWPVCADGCGPQTAVWLSDQPTPYPERQNGQWWRNSALPFGSARLSAETWPKSGPVPHALIQETQQLDRADSRVSTIFYRILAAGFASGDEQPAVLESIIAVPYRHPGRADDRKQWSALPCSASKAIGDAGRDIYPLEFCGRLAWRYR